MGASNLSKIVSATTFERAVEKITKEDLRAYKSIVRNDEDRYEDMAYEDSWMSKIHFHGEGFKNLSSRYYANKNLTSKRIHDIENEILEKYDDKYGPIYVTQITATKFLFVCWVPC